jgi:hypothetical protein
MGQVSTSPATDRTLTVLAAGLPAGSGVRVVQGLVDYAGLDNPDPVVQTLGDVLLADSFAAGSQQVAFSAAQGTYLRVEVLATNGTVVAGSNPVFALSSPPPAYARIAAGRLSSAQ